MALQRTSDVICHFTSLHHAIIGVIKCDPTSMIKLIDFEMNGVTKNVWRAMKVFLHLEISHHMIIGVIKRDPTSMIKLFYFLKWIALQRTSDVLSKYLEISHHVIIAVIKRDPTSMIKLINFLNVCIIKFKEHNVWCNMNAYYIWLK